MVGAEQTRTARSGPPSVGSLSTVAARPAVAALERRGLDPRPALERAQLSRATVESHDLRIPHASVRALWEAAAEMTGDRWFGIHTARDLPQGSFELLEYLLATPPTVRAGIERVIAYVRLVSDQANMRLIAEPRDARIVRRDLVPAPQYDEFTLALLFTRCRQNTGAQFRAKRVVFQHPRPDDDGEAAVFFECPVEFGAPETELRFSAALLDLPQARADSHLLAVLTRYADSLLAAIPDPGSLVSRVRAAITRQATREFPTLSSTARAVGLTPRALQRQLAAAGFTYSGLVDEARRQLALKYLGNASLSVTDIGYLLHFSDAASFHRAFKRWTGEAPLEYRRRLFAG
ncbi:MAG: AraC family transcriptional regulator [Pseudomonadota bacterium]